MSDQPNTTEIEIMPEEQPQEQPRKASLIPANTTPGFGTKASWDLVAVQSAALSRSTIIPKEFQGRPENCVIALNMANRLGADPLMVMQNLYIVSGKPGWSSQFLISTFNTCGRFSAIRYEFSGIPGTDERGCKAWAIESLTGEKLTGSEVTIGIAKAEGWYGKNGSKWQTMPEQMLMYRAASWFVRAYAPEISMGLQTVEELRDTVDMEEGENGSFTVSPNQKGNDKFGEILGTK